MNELKVFVKEDFQVSILLVDGKEYFPATEVAKVLGYTNPNKAILDHCKQDGVTKREVIDSMNRVQTMNFITEGNLYRLISRSKLPAAEKFESWVFDEVLPSVRKNGIYATEVTVEKMLSDPDFAIELLTTLKEERAKRIEVEKTNTILMHVNKNYTSTEIAKELGLKSATELNKILAHKHIQYKQNETWVLYSEYANKGYADIKQQVLDNGKVVYDRKWTQLGRKFLLELLK